MKREAFKRYIILSEYLVKVDHLKTLFNLSEDEVKSIIEELVNEGKLKLISEGVYQVVELKNQESIYLPADKREEQFIRALWFCVNNNKVSISLIQRNMPISYNRAKQAINWAIEIGYITKNPDDYKVNISCEEFIKIFGLPSGLDIFTEQERRELDLEWARRLNSSVNPKAEDSANKTDMEFPEDVWLAVLRLCVESNSASSMKIHRTYPSIGLIKAAKILDYLERRGFIGPVEGIKRKAIMSEEEFKRLFGDKN